MKKIKILYVIPKLAMAGTEKHLCGLASGLNKDKFEVWICCLFGENNQCAGVPLKDVRVINLNRKSVYDLRIIIDLYRLIKKERFDIVHAYLFGFHYLACLPAWLNNVKGVISSRRELAAWKKSHHHFLENFGNLFVDKVVACSENVKSYTLKTELLSANKVITIYNGIDLTTFFPHNKNIEQLNAFGLKENDCVIGNVSNFSIEKNHKLLLEVVKKIKDVFPQVKCLLVGEGYLKKDIEQEVMRLGLTENIIFTGRRNNIEEIIPLMDVFVFTSGSEGLPNTILEAMSCGLAVVTTGVGGIPEVIINGENGIIINSQLPDDFSSAVISLLKNHGLRKEIGGKARKTIETKFSLNRMLNDYENFYNSLLR